MPKSRAISYWEFSMQNSLPSKLRLLVNPSCLFIPEASNYAPLRIYACKVSSSQLLFLTAGTLIERCHQTQPINNTRITFPCLRNITLATTKVLKLIIFCPSHSLSKLLNQLRQQSKYRFNYYSVLHVCFISLQKSLDTTMKNSRLASIIYGNIIYNHLHQSFLINH